MTNSQIIYNAAQAHGFTADQLQQLLDAYKGDLPFHTFQEWKARGYSVKKGEHALFTCELWRYTTKPSKAVREAAAAAGENVPEDGSGHYYKAKAFIFSFAQVQRIAKGATKQNPV